MQQEAHIAAALDSKQGGKKETSSSSDAYA